MAKFLAVLEKRTVERMAVEIEAKSLAQALVKAERLTEYSKVRGVTILKPYDIDSASTEHVVEVRARS